ncbi:Hsp20/alpha crystallin family protein [Candidatus Parcubacteria bacterium]|jgi:HSP20 family protein|nr:MAG: Hsp20/alpha crystallin family protein [Candidatus Parcubacteria bacterium]
MEYFEEKETQQEPEDIFVELAKVKSSPAKIVIEEDPKSSVMDEQVDEIEGQLTVDVYQDGDDIVVQSTVAGVSPDDLDIHITPESVTVKGSREKSQKIEDKDYFYQECFWGRFSRSVILPAEVDPEKSTATVKNGVLTVRMPRLNRQKGKKVKVKSD